MMSDSMLPPALPTGYGQADAMARVQAPAIALIATGGLGLLLALVGLVLNVLGLGLTGLSDFADELGGYEQTGNLLGGALGAVSAVVQLAIGGFIVWAGFGMLKLQRWTLAVVASVLAFVPCLSPCCCLGIPVGIWSLVVLMTPEVKSAFSS
jgi:hypothetical protein